MEYIAIAIGILIGATFYYLNEVNESLKRLIRTLEKSLNYDVPIKIERRTDDQETG